MTETEFDTSGAQQRARLPKEVQSLFFAIVFAGLTLSFAGCASLFFLTSVFQAESSNIMPGFAVFSIVMAICALIARQCAGFFATKRGTALSFALCFVCGGLGPLGLLLGAGFWWWTLCVSAIGCLCIMYEWWSHLCALDHRVLVLFVSSAILVGAGIVLILAFLGAKGSAGAIVTSVLLLISTVLLFFLDDGSRAALYSVDVRESLNRVRSLYMRRLGEFSYFAIGLMMAVVVELGAFMAPEIFPDDAYVPVVMFAIAIALIFVLCFFSHWKTDFDLEGYSKDYLAFTCAIGFLPLPFVSGVPLFVLFVYLMFLVGLQLTLVISAIIELARFEEISPLWYLGETTFLFVGMCIGSVAAKVCFLQMPGHQAIIAICMSAVIFIAFAQVFFNKFSYPEIELFKNDEEDTSSRIAQKVLTGADFAGERAAFTGERAAFTGERAAVSADPGAVLAAVAEGEAAALASRPSGASGAGKEAAAISAGIANGIQADGFEGAETNGAGAAEAEKKGSRFRNRIAQIEEVYGLSPRQREILELLAKGRNAGYIMEHFHISRSTVKTHVYNIYVKLEIHSRQELLDLIESDEELKRPGL